MKQKKNASFKLEAFQRDKGRKKKQKGMVVQVNGIFRQAIV